MKKKLSLLLAIIVTISNITLGSLLVHAADMSFTDVTETTANKDAIIALTKLGIINGYENTDKTMSFKPDGDITRAEFTKIITTAMNATSTTGGDSSFTDVNSHWAKQFIQMASDMKIVNGFEDNTFRPDEKVTYEQAVKMIVCTLGYENAATALGGWPSGYLTEGATLGITKDASVADQTAGASRGVVAKLVYNALDVDIPEYDVTTGKLKSNLETFIEKYLNVAKVKCRVVGVEDNVTSECTEDLYNDEMAILTTKGNKLIKIDYSTYTDDNTVVEAFLGQEIVAFYNIGKSDAANTLLEIDAETVKNTNTTVFSEDIDSFSGTAFKYYDANDKTKTLNIKPSEATIYYNGKIVENCTESQLTDWLSPSSSDFIYGDVTLVDSGSNNTIDFVKIMNYSYLVASKTPSTADYLVTNKVKFTKTTAPKTHLISVELNPDSAVYTTDITNAAGTKVAVTSIKANDVLLYAESLDGDLKTVKVSSTPVTGKITAYSAENKEITVSSKKYDISDYCRQSLEDETGVTIKTSLQGTFYTDVFGTIIYATTSTSTTTSPYAYIITASLNDDQDGGTIVAYLPASSAKKTYTISNKLKYNDNTVTASEAIQSLRKNSEDEDTTDKINRSFRDYQLSGVYDKAITYDPYGTQIARIVVSGSEVTEITTADYSAFGTTTEDTSALSSYSDLANVKYTKTNDFDGKFYINSATTILFVPQDRKSGSFSKKTASAFTIGQPYWVQPFNVNSSKIAGLVLMYGASASNAEVTYKTAVNFVATSPVDVENNDEYVSQVSMFMATNTITDKKAEDNNSFAGLKPGDAIRFGYDSDNLMTNLETMIAYDNIKSILGGETTTRKVTVGEGESATEEDVEFTRDWTCGTSTTDSNYKKWKVDKFRWFTSESATTGIPYQKVFMANPIEILEDGSSYAMRVTRDGFDADGKLDYTNEERVQLIKDVKIVRYDTTKNNLTQYKDGSTTEMLTLDDIKTAEIYGDKCNSVMIYSFASATAKFIVIY